MTSLVMLAWMSVLTALVHVRAERSKTESISFLCVQLVCLVAGAAEAGRVESGQETKGRRALHMAALLVTIGYVMVQTVIKGP